MSDFSVVKPAVFPVVNFGMVHNTLNQRKYSLEKKRSSPKKYPLEVGGGENNLRKSCNRANLYANVFSC